MAQKLYEESNVQAIANAIRAKNESTAQYKLAEMAAAIQAIPEDTDGGATAFAALPAYWQTYLRGKIKTAAERCADVIGHGDSFAFCTDSHYPTNTLYAGKLLRVLMAQTGAGMAIHGGDAVSDSDTAETALSRLNTFFDSWDGVINWYAIPGNHDSNSNSSSAAHPLTAEQYYNAVYARFAGRVQQNGAFGTASQFDYYIDRPAAKIRYILLFTGFADSYTMTDAQVAWMQARLAELASDWTAVIISHQHINGYAGVGNTDTHRDTNGKAIQEGIQAASYTCTVACCIAGHQHRDYTTTFTAHGVEIPLIVTTCDAYQGALDWRTNESGTSSLRTTGAVTENVLDIFAIDTAAKQIYITRIGAGQDRAVSYGDAQTVYTVTANLSNVTLTGGASTVTEGGAYSATVAANAGCTLDSVTVTMGGADITATAYSNGTITIPAVTGNVVITASATVIPVAVTNYAHGYAHNTRLNSSGTTTAQSGTETTDFIPISQAGDTVRLYNAGCTTTKNATNYNGQYIAFYDADKNKLQSVNVYNWVTGTNGKATLECTEDSSNNLTSFKVKTLANATYPLTGLAYCRISALGITDSTVITVNQEWDGSSATVNP